jgi:hypothetical protein
MRTPAIEGGCFCGAIRYRARAAPIVSMVCHCRSCRRTSGVPAVPWLTFRASEFAFVRGTPAAFASSPPVTRTFCPTCGTSLTYVHAGRPDEVDVTTASLDDPERFPPTYHAWIGEGIGWLRFGDGLPTFAAARPEG